MPSVADFLIERMENSGVRHVFGVPGEYTSNFFKKLADSDVELIHTTQEGNAAFAADAYARFNGIGCVCVSQDSALKIANAVSCSQAECSPVVVIVGAPRQGSPTVYKLFESITGHAVILDNPTTAGYQIDSILEELKYYREPVYIHLLQDVADKPLVYDVYKQGTPKTPESNGAILAEAIEEVVDWINSAEQPVILAGVQLARYGLGVDLLKFAQRFNIPVVTTLLSKSVVDETHPLFAGVYVGEGSQPSVKALVERSDCLLTLGVPPRQKDAVPAKKHIVSCSSGVEVKNHQYTNVTFKDFIHNLFKAPINRPGIIVDISDPKPKAFHARNGVRLTMARFFEKINSVLTEEVAVISDVGDALLGASDLVIHHPNHFLATAFRPSMGFSIPAAIGLQTAAPKVRPIVIVGDGAFQVSVAELSTIVGRRLNPIVLVLNNRRNGDHDLREWDYEKVVEMFGGEGAVVEDEQQLSSIINVALEHSGNAYIINVKLDANDEPPALLRMRKEKR